LTGSRAGSWAGGGPPARRGGGWDREDDPFAKEERERAERLGDTDQEATVFDAESTGINFDAYEDIPVETSGRDPPAPVQLFADLDLGPALEANVRRCRFVKPTPVQRHSIPIGLAGRDLMVCAQTGSGKTAAFMFPIIAGILRSNPPPPVRGRKAFPLALVMSPTRELASQIMEESRKFSYQTGLKVAVCYGGAPIHHQMRELERGCDILVGTPGRLTDLLERGKVSLQDVRYLALDEADRMLDMGFEPQIRRIVEGSGMPNEEGRTTLLFSATFPREIQRMATDFLHDYIFIAVGRVGSSTDLISQSVLHVQHHEKRSVLCDLVHSVSGLTLVFVETKRSADSLEDFLCMQGFPATSIHGDRSQPEREQALRSFKSGHTPVLVATDVAARGLDIPNVAHVINYDLPNDIDDYVHRIGRTGRAGKKGLATAMFSDQNVTVAKDLADLMSEAGQEVPSWLLGFASQSRGGTSGKGRRGKFGGTDFRKGGAAAFPFLSSPAARGPGVRAGC
jgi:ATP-dependent RNA helicase DDX3X